MRDSSTLRRTQDVTKSAGRHQIGVLYKELAAEYSTDNLLKLLYHALTCSLPIKLSVLLPATVNPPLLKSASARSYSITNWSGAGPIQSFWLEPLRSEKTSAPTVLYTPLIIRRTAFSNVWDALSSVVDESGSVRYTLRLLCVWQTSDSRQLTIYAKPGASPEFLFLFQELSRDRERRTWPDTVKLR